MSLRDYGLSSTGEKIQVEHILVLSLSSSWEEPVRRFLKAWGESGKSVVNTFQAIGYGVATYLVLAGISRVIDSTRWSQSRKIK